MSSTLFMQCAQLYLKTKTGLRCFCSASFSHSISNAKLQYIQAEKKREKTNDRNVFNFICHTFLIPSFLFAVRWLCEIVEFSSFLLQSISLCVYTLTSVSLFPPLSLSLYFSLSLIPSLCLSVDVCAWIWLMPPKIGFSVRYMRACMRVLR